MADQETLRRAIAEILSSDDFVNRLQSSLASRSETPSTPIQNLSRTFPNVRSFSTNHSVAGGSSTSGACNAIGELRRLFPSVSGRHGGRKRSSNDAFSTFKRDVIMVDCNVKRTLTGLNKAQAYEKGHALSAVVFDKRWSEREVFEFLSNLYSQNLEGKKFEILLPISGNLVKPNVANGGSLDGSTVYTIFVQKPIYIRPVENESNYQNEDTANQVQDTHETGKSQDLSDTYYEELFESDTLTAISNSLASTSTYIDSSFETSKTEAPSFVAILKNLQDTINQEKVSFFNVFRENVLQGCKRAINRKSFSPLNRISVIFTDSCEQSEGAVDIGGPTRELFRLAMKAIRDSKLFEGPENEKNISLCYQALQNRDYFEAGQLIVLSLIHGGQGPKFFSDTLFTYLFCGSEFVKPSINEVVDENIREEIEMAQHAKSLEELQAAVCCSPFLALAGFHFISSLDKREEVVDGAIKFYVVVRNKEALEQLKDGLNTCGFLDMVKPVYLDCKKFMTYRRETLHAEIIKNMLEPILSADGSTKRSIENKILSFWYDYLLDCDEKEAEASLEEILMFVTGTDSIPPLGFQVHLHIDFLHDEQSQYPKANTCSLILYLPVQHKNYETFKKCMDYGIKNGMVFGFA